MRVRNKRVLKNGTVAGYVQQKDGSWKWRFIGGSKKTTKKKTTTKKRGGMMRGFVPNSLRERLGYETNAQIAEREEADRRDRNRRERVARANTRLSIIYSLNRMCSHRSGGRINFNSITREDMDKYINSLRNLRQLSEDEQRDVYCELRKYSDWVAKVEGRNVYADRLNHIMNEIINLLVEGEIRNNRRNNTRNNRRNQPNHPRNTRNGQGAARGGMMRLVNGIKGVV